MTTLTPTRLRQVVPVRSEQGSAVASMKPALEAADVNVGDTVAFGEQADKQLVVVSGAPGSVSIDEPTRAVRRGYQVAIPSAFYDVLGIDSPSGADEGAELARVAVYVGEETGTIALGTNAGPAVEPITGEE